jgi:hypothetical protein
MSTVTHEEIDSFVMPTVDHGAVVAWYPNGLPSDRPQVGYVIRVQHRGLTIMTAANGVRDIVRHITDPKLRLNPEHRENGGWDYTEDYKERQAEVAGLQARVTRLEARLESMSSDTEPAQTEPSEYDQLWRRAKDAGIVFKGRPSKGWLERQIADLQEKWQAAADSD